jgi:vacuolar-type H+-ATPase subunit H
MPETSPVQGTLQRLIEAEEQAQQILRAAQAKADETLAQAREQARQDVEAFRAEGQGLLRAKLSEAESKGAAEMKRRLELAEAQAQAFHLRAERNFSRAVEMVVNAILSGEEI